MLMALQEVIQRFKFTPVVNDASQKLAGPEGERPTQKGEGCCKGAGWSMQGKQNLHFGFHSGLGGTEGRERNDERWECVLPSPGSLSRWFCCRVVGMSKRHYPLAVLSASLRYLLSQECLQHLFISLDNYHANPGS